MYDLANNNGWVPFGSDADTVGFAVNTLHYTPRPLLRPVPAIASIKAVNRASTQPAETTDQPLTTTEGSRLTRSGNPVL
ncbi:hypothetical protein [Actinospica durhamensis]|uniref:hypothetical protein n=1 Tax=Actinospica durhamensis TaxID=1508375 RepID=UPI0034D3E52A